jgi:uncharacterized membrane protein
MIEEALLAYVHFIAIFGLVCTLVGELFLFRRSLPEAMIIPLCATFMARGL